MSVDWSGNQPQVTVKNLYIDNYPTFTKSFLHVLMKTINILKEDDFMIEQEDIKLNPLLTVWLHPKKTARYVIENKGFPYTLFIIAISYIGVFCSSVIDTELYPFLPIWGILLLLLILSPILGIMSNAFYAVIIWPMGKLFKGIGNYQEIFKGLSLTAIPFIVLIPFYILWMITDPYSLFYTDIEGSLVLPLFTILLTIAASIWSFIISIAVVAEVHNISNWKAFFVLFIPSVLFTILIIIVVIILALIIIGFSTFFMF